MSSYGEFLVGAEDLDETVSRETPPTPETVKREDDAKREQELLREAQREEGFTRG